jgi:plastocyanin
VIRHSDTGGKQSIMQRLSSPILRRAALGAVVAAVGVPAGALATTGHSAAAKIVTVKSFKFSPATVKIKTGQSVTWRFKDAPTPHNVKGGGGIKSKASITTGSYTHKFTKKGTFSYICTIHPNMKGKVVVS